MGRLDGKVAIVTGASRGIGRAIAIELAREGVKVALNYQHNEALAHEVANEIVQLAEGRTRAVGGQTIRTDDVCILAQANVADPQESRDMVKKVVEQWGRLDILVNNAGIIRRADSLDFTEADWDAVVDTNLKTVFFLSQAVARRWVADGRGGKIINVVSMLSFQGGLRVPSYTASKSGLAGLTKALCNEWAGRGINVNGLAPGYFATNNTAALQADEARNRQILERIPAGRWGQPGDLAGAAVFLASRAADYMHGAIVPVDGGWLAR